MVNNPNSVPPTGSGAGAHRPEGTEKKRRPDGQFQFTTSHKFAGMTFDPKEWTKLMNIMLRNLNQYISQTFKKMDEKLKKDWKRGEGKDVD